jgi:hypothetical protein
LFLRRCPISKKPDWNIPTEAAGFEPIRQREDAIKFSIGMQRM